MSETTWLDLAQQMWPNLSLETASWYFLTFALLFMRFLVLVCTAPFFGSNLLPGRCKVLLGLFLALLFFPASEHLGQSLTHWSLPFLFLLFVKEMLVGLVIGFLSSGLIFVFECAGQMIDFVRGANMARLLIPELREHSSPMGSLYCQLAICLFFTTGLFRHVILAIGHSVTQIPPHSLGLFSHHVQSYLESAALLFGRLFLVAFSISAPVAMACLLTDLAFGLLNRTAPQIQAYFMSLPAKMAGGLFLALLAMPSLWQDFPAYAKSFLNILEGFLLGSH